MFLCVCSVISVRDKALGGWKGDNAGDLGMVEWLVLAGWGFSSSDLLKRKSLECAGVDFNDQMIKMLSELFRRFRVEIISKALRKWWSHFVNSQRGLMTRKLRKASVAKRIEV